MSLLLTVPLDYWRQLHSDTLTWHTYAALTTRINGALHQLYAPADNNLTCQVVKLLHLLHSIWVSSRIYLRIASTRQLLHDLYLPFCGKLKLSITLCYRDAPCIVQSHISRLGNSTKLWGYDFHGHPVAMKLTNGIWMIEENNGDLHLWQTVVSYTRSEERISLLTILQSRLLKK